MKYVCPNCGNDLTLSQTKDWGVDRDTGLLIWPMVSNFLVCTECDFDVDSDEIAGIIVNLNLENDTL